MPELLVDFRFFKSSDSAKIQTSRRGETSSTDGEDSSTMVGKGEA